MSDAFSALQASNKNFPRDSAEPFSYPRKMSATSGFYDRPPTNLRAKSR